MRRSWPTKTTAAAALVALLVSVAGTALAGPATGATTAPAAAPRYDVVASIVVESGDEPVGRGMNEVGTIVGWAGWPYGAVYWDDGTGTTILPGLPGDEHRTAVDVNDAGVAVGESGFETIDPPQHATRWVNGEPEDLGTLPGGGDSHAEAINEAGMIVGWGYVGSDTHAFVWTEDDGMIDITPTAQFAYAYDVNEAGQVVGYIGGQAFLWEDGELTGLGTAPGFALSAAFAINDDGVVAGQVTTASGNSERVASWTAADGWTVLGGAGEHNAGWGINRDGTVVGTGSPAGGLEQAVVYLEGFGLLTVGELLTTNDYFLTNAFDVDDAGRILAVAHNRRTGNTETLLLEPDRKPMHDERLRVRAAGSPDLDRGVATLRVLDDAGNPVRRARIDGTWYLHGAVVANNDLARTEASGRAALRHRLGELSGGDVVKFCIASITSAKFQYQPPDGGSSCDSVRVS